MHLFTQLLTEPLNIILFFIWHMAKSFACSDVGMNCDWTASTDNEEELMTKIKEHAKNAHNLNEISPDLHQKVKSAIK